MLKSRTLRVFFFLVLLSLAASAQDAADPGVKDPTKFDPKRPLAQELGPANPLLDPLIVVAVGDCIISRPLSQYGASDPYVGRVLELLRAGDVTYGNLETSILDIRSFKGFPYTALDDVPLIADPAVAQDLAHMGFDLMSRANNHALDWGIEGMRETTHYTDQAGIVTAGVGENLGQARAARYYESSGGRIGLVSMATTFRPSSNALPEQGAAPSRPGINGLALSRTFIVPRDVMHDLGALSQKLYPESKPASPGKLSLFDVHFEVGPKRALHYEMDSTDLAEILKAVRQGKQHSDLLLVSIHSHESADSTAPAAISDFADTPADFVPILAKAAIDAGADAFLATGIHHLGPIEIYKGRPIFYGLGDFFWSDIQEPMPADFYAQYRRSLEAFQHPERATDADLMNALNAETFAGPLPFESVITTTRFDHGRVSEIRLYPIWLGYGMKLTESGIPRVASADKATEILTRLQTISAPLGTKISIEPSPEWHSIGVIRP
jgi:poly-gamma-glutamate synthesis protein (capsule biosynthesis protein)